MGGKYESNPLNSFCEEHGIIHETTPPYSSESNGVVERKKYNTQRYDELNVGEF